MKIDRNSYYIFKNVGDVYELITNPLVEKFKLAFGFSGLFNNLN